MRERALEAFLSCVLGILTISSDPKGDPPDTPSMPFDEITERGWMTHPSCCQKHSLFHAWSNVPERG
jgi:hypothetical protein